MNKEAKEVLFNLFDAWKRGDVEAYLSCFAEEFESSHPLGKTSDRAHIRKEIELVIEHWRDRTSEIINLITQGDTIAVEYEMTMTGTGQVFEGTVTLPGLVLATVRDGCITRYREEYDPRIVLRARVAPRASE